MTVTNIVQGIWAFSATGLIILVLLPKSFLIVAIKLIIGKSIIYYVKIVNPTHLTG